MVIDDAALNGELGCLIQTGQIGTFNTQQLQVVDLSERHMLFAEYDGRRSAKPTGRCELFSIEGDRLGKSIVFELPAGAEVVDMHFGTANTVLAYFEQSDAGPGVARLSVEAGTVSVSDLGGIVPNNTPAILGWVHQDDGSALLITRTDSFDVGFTPETATITRTVRAIQVNEGSEPRFAWSLGARHVDFSPDGRLLIWEELQHEVFPDVIRYSERWPSLVVPTLRRARR